MLATDHLPLPFVRWHARTRFVQRVRADLKGAPEHHVDRAIREMLDAGSLRFGVPSWKVGQGPWVTQRSWMVELVVACRELRRDGGVGELGPRRVCFLLSCRTSPFLGESWRVLTVLTGPAPRILLDVFEAAA